MMKRVDMILYKRRPYGGNGPYGWGPYVYRRPYGGYYGRPYEYGPYPPPVYPPYGGARGLRTGLITGLLLG
uniref:Spore coat protein n=1 Tax=Heterorhabditis bacteriophora TaxID=37862 RepID=A0A1I7XLF2_HETBA